MAVRLLGWLRRDAAPAGRHARVLPVVTVPGAAATIVGSAVRDPLVGGSVLVAQPPVAVLPEPVEPAPAAEVLHELSTGVEDEHLAVPAVGLVFADGDSVQLDDDDPRVRTFRATAAALLEHTPS